jgi:hypothetical protein
MDGLWQGKTIGPATLCGEQMRDGRFYAFDCVQTYGQDLRPLPLCARMAALHDLERGEFVGLFLRPATGQRAEFWKPSLPVMAREWW